MAARNYVFTSYKSHPEFQDGLRQGEPLLFICYGVERCPTTSRVHLQGYLRFSRPVRLAGVRTVCGDPSIHLERRRGTEQQAVDYCHKDADASAADGHIGFYYEWGVRGAQGKRTDIDTIRDIVADGGGMRRVIAEATSIAAVLAAPKFLTYIECGKRVGAPTVNWYWGKTGTGKTRAAIEEAESHGGGDPLWISSDTFKWFDGYDAHDVVLFDDFRSDGVSLPWMLRLLDRYPVRVPIKGGYRAFKPKVIYITCPRPPQECFLESGEDVDQLLRRITNIKEFT